MLAIGVASGLGYLVIGLPHVLALAVLAGASWAALAFRAVTLFAAVVLRFASLGMVALLPMAQILVRNQDTASWPIGMAHSAPRLTRPREGGSEP